MRDNDFEASEYVGWGFRIQELLKPSEAADLLIWRNIYELPRIQKITLRIIEGKYCNYYNNSPIICTVSDQKNMNLSEVSSTFCYLVKINISAIENVT